MKIALITDQHFGARNDSKKIHDHFERFYSEVFFPTLRDRNIDTVIVAERPKLKPYIELMKKNLAKTLQIDPEYIGIKATTNEKLGPEGREEGISCHSVVLLEKK